MWTGVKKFSNVFCEKEMLRRDSWVSLVVWLAKNWTEEISIVAEEGIVFVITSRTAVTYPVSSTTLTRRPFRENKAVEASYGFSSLVLGSLESFLHIPGRTARGWFHCVDNSKSCISLRENRHTCRKYVVPGVLFDTQYFVFKPPTK